jgi:hypothetical protein
MASTRGSVQLVYEVRCQGDGRSPCPGSRIIWVLNHDELYLEPGTAVVLGGSPPRRCADRAMPVPPSIGTRQKALGKYRLIGCG